MAAATTLCQVEFKASLVYRIPQQPGLHRETLFQKTKTTVPKTNKQETHGLKKWLSGLEHLYLPKTWVQFLAPT